MMNVLSPTLTFAIYAVRIFGPLIASSVLFSDRKICLEIHVLEKQVLLLDGNADFGILKVICILGWVGSW